MSVLFPELRKLRRYGALEGKTFVVCVGAMKSATSWVHDYLGARDGVVVSPLKELHFFSTKFGANALGDMDALALKRLAFHLRQDGDVVDNLRRRETFQASVDRAQMVYDDDAYFAHFARLCTPETRTFCDITPAYATLGPAGFEYLREFCATQDVALRLVFVMRDPIDRLWSQLRHMEQTNPENKVLENWAEAFASPRICARADYRGTISDLDASFPAADILYLFYEELFSEAALRRLCAHADAPYGVADAGKVRNETSVKAAMPQEALSAAQELLAPQYAFCRTRFGEAIPEGWQG